MEEITGGEDEKATSVMMLISVEMLVCMRTTILLELQSLTKLLERHSKGGTALQANFETVCAFSSKITTNW